MSHRRERLAEYVAAHPDCTVTDIADFLNTDAAGAWDALIDAQRFCLIDMNKPDGGRWQFTPISR